MAGILMGLTLITPQLFRLVIPALLCVMSLSRRWPFLASFVTTAAGLVVGSWLLVPDWPAGWQEHLVGTAEVRLAISPTLWGFSHTIVTALGREDLWGVASLSACVMLGGALSYLWYVIRRGAFRHGDQLTLLLSLIVTVSLLVAPYVLSYDFALLLFPVMTCLWLIQPISGLMRRPLLATLMGCVIFLPWVCLPSRRKQASKQQPCSFRRQS